MISRFLSVFFSLLCCLLQACGGEDRGFEPVAQLRPKTNQSEKYFMSGANLRKSDPIQGLFMKWGSKIDL